MNKIINNLIKISLVVFTVGLVTSCNEAEETKYVFDNVSAPTDFSANLVTSGDDNETVTITPVAQNVAQFEVYFGETEDETPVIVLPGESTSYTYAELGEYEVKVIAVGSTGLTSEFVQVIEAGEEIIVVPEMLVLPVDHESTELVYDWAGFGNATAEVTANPDATGSNTTATVLQVTKANGAEVWAGVGLPLDDVIDFTTLTNVSVKVWSPRVGTPILFKIEDTSSAPDANGNPSVVAEVSVASSVANAWEELIFDMTTFAAFDASASYDKIVVFPDFGTAGADEVFYFDEFALTADSGNGGGGTTNDTLQLPIDLESTTLTYEWGGFGSASPAVIANPDASGINTSATVLEVVKANGAEVWAGVSLPLDGVIDFSGSSNVSVKVWSPRVGTPILFKVEDSNSAPDANGNPSVVAEVSVSSTVANAWEELIFDMTTFGGFDVNASYDTVVLFPDFGTNGADETFYFDDIALSAGSGSGSGGTDDLPQLPVDLESTTLTYEWGGFGNANPAVIANPDASGINTSATVLEVTKAGGAETWAGVSLGLDGAIDFSSSSNVSVKVWSPRVGTPILFKIEDTSSAPDANGNPSVVAEVSVSSTVANAWEELVFDMATFAGFDANISYDNIVLFPDFGNVGNNEIFYFDDIEISN